MTGSGLNPRDMEAIAAFIDRRLSPEERRAFMGRLDDEEELYEVFAETVRCRDQEVGGRAVVLEHPAGRRRWPQLAAIAAVVAVALATPVVLRNLPEPRYAQQLVADGTLGVVLEQDWLVKGWSVTRGASPGTDEFGTAFRLGVRQVDLEVALHLERIRDVEILSSRLEHQLYGLPGADRLRVAYAEVGARAGEPARALELAEAIGPDLEEALGENRVAYALGMWAETGVLAARSGNAELLGSRGFRRGLQAFQAEEWPALAAELDEIADLLDSSAEQPDLSRLAAAFTAIIDKG